MEKLKDVLSKISGGKVLDVGTGRGEFIDLLKENLKDYTELFIMGNKPLKQTIDIML